ncbi:hypothetical protein [Sphingomonas sp. Leaf28]|uniref:hypothetical protein n=1 Tax=Sphingomonas sp. Leaf28 TaxID=1735695 RepID=UPI0012E1472C|nr:hypothetical protein [Sphingomonas sp. Leaf28]
MFVNAGEPDKAFKLAMAHNQRRQMQTVLRSLVTISGLALAHPMVREAAARILHLG